MNKIEYGTEFLDQLKDKVHEQQWEIERLNNIIKEVREYITYWHYRNDFRINSFTTGVKEELFKILDKGVDKK